MRFKSAWRQKPEAKDRISFKPRAMIHSPSSRVEFQIPGEKYAALDRSKMVKRIFMPPF